MVWLTGTFILINQFRVFFLVIMVDCQISFFLWLKGLWINSLSARSYWSEKSLNLQLVCYVIYHTLQRRKFDTFLTSYFFEMSFFLGNCFSFRLWYWALWVFFCVCAGDDFRRLVLNKVMTLLLNLWVWGCFLFYFLFSYKYVSPIPFWSCLIWFFSTPLYNNGPLIVWFLVWQPCFPEICCEDFKENRKPL